MLKNITTPELEKSLREIAKAKTTQIIIPGKNYIPVTGKVLDEEDILLGVDAALDGWLTAGRFATNRPICADRRRPFNVSTPGCAAGFRTARSAGVFPRSS